MVNLMGGCSPHQHPCSSALSSWGALPGTFSWAPGPWCPSPSPFSHNLHNPLQNFRHRHADVEAVLAISQQENGIGREVGASQVPLSKKLVSTRARVCLVAHSRHAQPSLARGPRMTRVRHSAWVQNFRGTKNLVVKIHNILMQYFFLNSNVKKSMMNKKAKT